MKNQRARFAVVALLAAAGLGGSGCTPDIPNEPAPAAMEFDTAAVPPRVPQPIGLVINQQTGLIDFSLTGLALPADCANAAPPLSRAECEFDQYLQTLDGFPTVTPAQAPASAPLDPSTLTVGTNVVVVEGKTSTAVTDVVAGFDASSRSLTVRPARSWSVGGSYWVGVRGYANGVRALDGRQVVGSPTQFLLKQPERLTCDMMDEEHCPAYALLLQGRTGAAAETAATQSLVQLELIRRSFVPGWALMESVGGLPRAETAVMWNFPIHTASVAELDPSVGIVPRITGPDELRIAVQGTIDPATVLPFVIMVQYGTIVVMDLTAAQSGDARGGFPVVSASVADGGIVIKGQQPFVVGHQYGLFFTNGLRDARGVPLVPSPVSVLLRLRGSLVDAAGGSTISSVSPANALLLEMGRQQLSSLFDDPSFQAFTRVTREQLVYCFAFLFGGAP